MNRLLVQNLHIVHPPWRLIRFICFVPPLPRYRTVYSAPVSHLVLWFAHQTSVELFLVFSIQPVLPFLLLLTLVPYPPVVYRVFYSRVDLLPLWHPFQSFFAFSSELFLPIFNRSFWMEVLHIVLFLLPLVWLQQLLVEIGTWKVIITFTTFLHQLLQRKIVCCCCIIVSVCLQTLACVLNILTFQRWQNILINRNLIVPHDYAFHRGCLISLHPRVISDLFDCVSVFGINCQNSPQQIACRFRYAFVNFILSS